MEHGSLGLAVHVPQVALPEALKNLTEGSRFLKERNQGVMFPRKNSGTPVFRISFALISAWLGADMRRRLACSHVLAGEGARCRRGLFGVDADTAEIK